MKNIDLLTLLTKLITYQNSNEFEDILLCDCESVVSEVFDKFINHLYQEMANKGIVINSNKNEEEINEDLYRLRAIIINSFNSNIQI